MLDPLAPSRHRYDDPLRESDCIDRRPPTRVGDASSVLAQLPDTRGTAASVVDAASPLSAAEVRDANAGARLDALRDKYSGPYTVDGQVVTAPPMFRMNRGANQESAKVHDNELAKIAARVGVGIEGVRGGYGRPQDLVKVTQALIDAGKLPPPPPGDAASRIKAMQWEWGIGVDCACYTYLAVEAAHRKSGGSLGLAVVGTENFRTLDGNKSWQKIDPTLARPGDVMTLDPTPPETVGHNVIVRSHTMKGTLHTFEVDSAWGAGADGDVKGGYRRDTWTYDETTRLWTWTNRHVSPPVTEVSTEGPSERFHGCYRPKVSR